MSLALRVWEWMQKDSGCNNNGVNNNGRVRRKGRRKGKESTSSLRVVPSNFSAMIAPMVMADTPSA